MPVNTNSKKTFYPKYLEPLYSSEVRALKEEYRELTGSFYHGFQVVDNPQLSVSQYIENLKKEVAKEKENKITIKV